MSEDLAQARPTLAFFPYTSEDVKNAYKLLKTISRLNGQDLTDVVIRSAKDVELVLKCAEGMISGLAKKAAEA